VQLQEPVLRQATQRSDGPAWCVPVGAFSRCACSPLKAPGLTVFRVFKFRPFHGPDSELQHDKHAINIRHIYHRLRRGMWTIPVSFWTHRVRVALSQVKAVSWVRPHSEIHSISTPHAQAQRSCAQLIHMFVHSQQVSGSLAGAGSQVRTSAPALA
jgi:hypothetical protein